MSDNVIIKEIFIHTSVEKVFKSFTDVDTLLSWHGKEAELNPVPGGIYKVVFEDGTTIIGNYIEVIPNKKLIYTARYGDVNSEITILFSERDGGTHIHLTQVFDPGQDISSFDGGWDYFLGLLVERWGR